MCLGDADVEITIRKSLAELRKTGTVGHRGGDADDARVFLGERDHRVGENVLELRTRARAALFRAVARLECVGADPVKGPRIALSRLVPLSFNGAHVQKHGTGNVFSGLQRIDEHVVVEAVDRTDIPKAELFEDYGGLLGRP